MNIILIMDFLLTLFLYFFLQGRGTKLKLYNNISNLLCRKYEMPIFFHARSTSCEKKNTVCDVSLPHASL